MRLDRFLPLAPLHGGVHAGGGGGAIIGLIIFRPLMIWAFIKIWSFGFHLIFGGREERNTYQPLASYPGCTVTQAGIGHLPLLRGADPVQCNQVQALQQ